MIGQIRAVWLGQAQIPVLFLGQCPLIADDISSRVEAARRMKFVSVDKCPYNFLPVEFSWDVLSASVLCVCVLRSLSITLLMQPCARPYIGGIHVSEQFCLGKSEQFCLGKSEQKCTRKQPIHP